MIYSVAHVCIKKALRSYFSTKRYYFGDVYWDGASYHKYKEMKAYLEEINQGKERDEWLLTCVLFAPNAPPAKSSRRYLASCQNLGKKIWESA